MFKIVSIGGGGGGLILNRRNGMCYPLCIVCVPFTYLPFTPFLYLANFLNVHHQILGGLNAVTVFWSLSVSKEKKASINWQPGWPASFGCPQIACKENKYFEHEFDVDVDVV